MPNTARLAPAAFLPLARVPPRPVFAREERGRSSLKSVSGFAVLLLLCLILYAPGLASIPPVHRARFAQATRQMLETGDFIRIFPLRTATQLATAAPEDRQLAGAGMALVSHREDAAFRKFLATRRLNLSAVDRVTGLD
jgi:hypothetical protein